MKKFLIPFVALLAACCLSCATNTQQDIPIDSRLPWECDSTFSSEYCKYDVTRFFVGNDDIKYGITKDSYLEYTLTRFIENNNSLYSLETRFVINYIDSENNEFGGMTDEITSTAVFRRDTLAAVRTTKTATLETSDLSYSFRVDYENCEAVYDAGDTHIEKKFNKGSYVDNEYIYYYVRCFKNLNENFDSSFKVINWYSCFKNNKIKTDNIRVRSFNSEGVSVPSDLLENFATGALDTPEDETGKLMSDTLLIVPTATAKTGQPIRVSFAANPYIADNDSAKKLNSYKLISKMLVQEYSVSGAVTYSTEYVLTDVQVNVK